jgi:hypothetical protein
MNCKTTILSPYERASTKRPPPLLSAEANFHLLKDRGPGKCAGPDYFGVSLFALLLFVMGLLARSRGIWGAEFLECSLPLAYRLFSGAQPRRNAISRRLVMFGNLVDSFRGIGW